MSEYTRTQQKVSIPAAQQPRVSNSNLKTFNRQPQGIAITSSSVSTFNMYSRKLARGSPQQSGSVIISIEQFEIVQHGMHTNGCFDNGIERTNSLSRLRVAVIDIIWTLVNTTFKYGIQNSLYIYFSLRDGTYVIIIKVLNSLRSKASLRSKFQYTSQFTLKLLKLYYRNLLTALLCVTLRDRKAFKSKRRSLYYFHYMPSRLRLLMKNALKSIALFKRSKRTYRQREVILHYYK